MANIKTILLATICLGVCSGIFIFGFWPFCYRPVNTAWLLDDGTGIHFEGEKNRPKIKTGGIAYTPQPIVYPQSDDSEKGAFSLEIWAEAAAEFHRGVGCIAILKGEGLEQEIFIGQWKSALIIRSFFYKSKRSRYYREVGVRGVLPANHSSFITISSNSKGTAVFRDGKLVRRISGVRLLPEDESLTGYRIFLGNGPNVGSPWIGNIYGFALYDRALTEREALNSYHNWTVHSKPKATRLSGPIVRYGFENVGERTVNSSAGKKNSLFIPLRFDLNQKILNPRRNDELDKSDFLINIIGFVPFGFFLLLWLSQVRYMRLWQAMLIVIFAGFLFSLGIESFQAYMPTRHSSRLDLICNTAGTLIGVFLSYWCVKKGWAQKLFAKFLKQRDQ